MSQFLEEMIDDGCMPRSGNADSEMCPEPNTWPDTIPGRDQFEGDIFHSARWDYNVDLRDKDVIVVGTGCSAAQFVPRLPKEPYNVKSLVQIMRSPPWVVEHPGPLLGLVKEKSWEKWTPRYVHFGDDPSHLVLR